MIRVAVSGAAGRMGRLTCETVAAIEDMELAAAYAPGHAGEEVAGVTAVEDPAGFECDVVVEFTTPDVVVANLDNWAQRGFHAVVGTSGFDSARLEALTRAWERAPGNCLVVPNFSIGAVLAMHFAELAAPHFEGVEIVELHHADKPDFPSGTALATAARVAAAGGSNSVDIAGRGTDVSGVPVHSIRLPGVIASQEAIFGSLGETVTIRHDTFSREAFMPGVLTAIRSVAGLPDKITLGLRALLGI